MQALQLGGGVIGAFGALQNARQKERIEEQYNRDAYGGLQKTRDLLQNANPMATRAAALSQLNDAQSSAMNMVANQAGGNAVGGASGDVTAANINAVKNSQALGGVAAQFGAQKAGIEQQAYADTMQKGAQLTSTNQQISDLSQKVNYSYQNKPTLLQALAGGLMGIGGGTNAYEQLTGLGQQQQTDTGNQALAQDNLKKKKAVGNVLLGNMNLGM